jgi:hypothetical protein
MSTAKWMDEGENRVLNILLGATPVDGVLYLGLYRNPTELSEEADLNDLDEPSGGGYGRIALTRGQWTIIGDEATYETQTFLAIGGDWGEIWGYFLATSRDNSGKLLAAEHLDALMNVVDGKGIKVAPKITVI